MNRKGRLFVGLTITTIIISGIFVLGKLLLKDNPSPNQPVIDSIVSHIQNNPEEWEIVGNNGVWDWEGDRGENILHSNNLWICIKFRSFNYFTCIIKNNSDVPIFVLSGEDAEDLAYEVNRIVNSKEFSAKGQEKVLELLGKEDK